MVDKFDWFAIALFAILVLVVLGIFTVTWLHIDASKPVCPTGYVAVYITSTGWICTVAPLTP